MVQFNIRLSPGDSPGIASRIFTSIFFLIFAAFGAVFIVLMFRSFLRDEDTRNWMVLACTIESISYDLPANERDNYKLNLRYRYTVDNQVHESDRISLSSSGYTDFEPIQRRMLQTPPGTQAVCFVNPKNPAESVLQQASRWTMLMILLPMVFVAVGVGGIWFIWRGRRQGSLSSAATTGTDRGRRLLPLFFGIFLLAGLGFGAAFASTALLRYLSARSWTWVEAVVVHSRVRAVRGDDGDTYAPDVLYRYEFGGQTYLSNRYGVMSGTSSGRAGKQQVVSRLRPGTRMTVFVNPKDPVIAVIDRSGGWWMLIGLLPLVFVLIGGGGLVWLWRGGGRSGPDSAIGSASGGNRRLARPGKAVAEAPLHYRSDSKRRTNVLAIAAVALFWNGISWTLAVVMYRERAGVFPLVFISLFLLIGLLLIGGFVHQLLAMFNPSLEFDITHSPVRLGDTVTAKWAFTGRFDRISRLTIILQGREEATYRRGTTTVTDKSIFRTLDLVDTSRQVDIARGTVNFVIPGNTMHSLSGSNNRIYWQIIVHGEIGNWPDVKEAIPFRIEPKKVFPL